VLIVILQYYDEDNGTKGFRKFCFS